MAIKNQVQLITYPDSLGGDLKTLNNVLIKYFKDVFKGGIHILPPFPSSGDRGFAPLTYFDIDPKFGSWSDIKLIGENFHVMLDLMVNHISAQSVFFQDFLKKGQESKYADLFITLDKIWKDGNPVKEDISKMFLRRKEPFSSFKIKDTEKVEKVWTTFGKEDPSEQIDMDMNSDIAKGLIREILFKFSEENVRVVRLDAVGFIIKKLGTSCFFVEPEIYDFIDWITMLANSLGIELLPEVHANYETQFRLAEHGKWIYDFILPYSILDALINKSSLKLREYLKVRPHNQFTMLDCHDGIPVKPDLEGLVQAKDAKKLVDICVARGANLSLLYSSSPKEKGNFNVHQIRCSYYSVLNCEDDAYLAARAIQLFTPGIPQIYYVGLLAGKNDDENVKDKWEGREINRHNFSLEEIEQGVKKEVVQRLLKLIRFRNDYPAFNGDFEVLNSREDEIFLSWKKEDKSCLLTIDLKNNKSFVKYIDKLGNERIYTI